MELYKVELSQYEFEALAGLIDAGVRGTGLRSAKDAAAIILKMEAAKSIVDASKVEEAS